MFPKGEGARLRGKLLSVLKAGLRDALPGGGNPRNKTTLPRPSCGSWLAGSPRP